MSPEVGPGQPSAGEHAAAARSGPLRSGQLGTADVTVSTVANIGPGIDFYFAFGVIAVTAGVAAPLTILAAGVAVVLLAWTVAEFTKVEPSAGSFITYVETGLGPRAGVMTALLVTVGYTVAMAGVFTMAGGMVTMTLAHYTPLDLPWGPLTVVLTVGATWLTAGGIRLSTMAVGVAVSIQVAVMLAVCVVVLSDQRGHLSAAPFSWSHLSGGLTGLSAGFPLALYMFIGWENGPALAEECRTPRRTVPRALYLSVSFAVVLFVVFAYSTITGFHYDVSSIGRSSIPFPQCGRQLPWRCGGSGVDRGNHLRPCCLGCRYQLPGADALRRGAIRSPAGLAGAATSPTGHTDQRARRHGRDRPRHHWGMGSFARRRRGHRVDESRRPVRRVLDHGHHRDPGRLPHDQSLAADLHLAPAPYNVLSVSPRGRTRIGRDCPTGSLH